MSFKVKTILLLLLISLIPYSITMFFFGSSFKKEQLKSVKQELDTQLTMTIDRIEQHLTMLQKDIAFIAKSDVMADIFTDDLDRRISHIFLEKKKDLKLKGDFFLVNKMNTVISSSNYNHIGKVFDKASRFSVIVHSPFDQSDIATLHVSYSLDNLAMYFKNTEHRHYYITNSENGILFQPTNFEEHISIKKELTSIPNVRIILSEDKDYAYRLIQKYQLWFFITLAIGGIAIFLLAFYFANHLIRPLKQLSRAAIKITTTQDYTTQIPIDRQDEIGQMEVSFNKMIGSMKHAIDEITALNKEVEDTQREVVFTMGAIGESRSKETGNHVKRVAEYSKLLALHYGLPEEEAEMLKQASPMHDIGKVAIPDAILNKPGKFTDEEFGYMKKHAELGHSMLYNSNRPLLRTASIVAYEHHEKWNGKGYPRGLVGEDIHIYGRITAVADVFDALGSDRVYKKAWNDDQIFSFFKEERGEHFDPKLIDIFFDKLDQFLTIREQFKDTF